jgi:hypothetical protein
MWRRFGIRAEDISFYLGSMAIGLLAALAMIEYVSR